MANGLYDKAREDFLDGQLSWTSHDFRVILVDAAFHTINLEAANPTLADIAGAARIAVSAAMTGKTKTGGVADADDTTIPGVSGDSVERLIIYRHTGTEATSRLVVGIDNATGLALTPNGGSVTITWPNGATKIFKL